MLDRVAQVLIVAVAVLVLGASARASSSDQVTYTSTRVHVAAAAVVDFRELARQERAERPRASGESEEAPEPEGKEDPGEVEEPNVRFTVPSPLVSPLSVTSTLGRRLALRLRELPRAAGPARRSARPRPRRRRTRTARSAATS